MNRALHIFVSVLLGWILISGPALAQSGGDFTITRSTLDAGGTTEKAEDIFVIRGTVGQPDAGTMVHGTYHLTGGLWSTQGRSQPIFCDGFESGDTSVWTSASPRLPAEEPGSLANLPGTQGSSARHLTRLSKAESISENVSTASVVAPDIRLRRRATPPEGEQP